MDPDETMQLADRTERSVGFRATPGLPDDVQIAAIMTAITQEYTDLTEALVIDHDVPGAARELLKMASVCVEALMTMGLRCSEIDELWVAVHRGQANPRDAEASHPERIAHLIAKFRATRDLHTLTL